MKITKEIKAEILQVMDDYWSSYFEGDFQTWTSYLPDHYRNIGSTKEEVWNSKKEIIDYTKRVYEQMVGMAELRNKTTQIISYDPHIMVHELGDMYIKTDEGWTYYAPFRVSSLLEKKVDGWKILQQHVSYPDPKTEKGEAFGFDEIKAENKKLKDAIQARTIELERKNRELEIEAALERIRAKTMAMQKSDELGATSLLLFDELKALGEISEQISIGIFDVENQILNLYTTLHGEQWKEATKVALDEPYAMQRIYRGWRQNKKSIQIDLRGEELKADNHFRNQYSNLKFPAERWVIHCAFFSKGVLSFSNTAPHDEQTMQLLERFAQVFDGTYTRFLDLQKAETQAREAQIEAALERVRAQTMAMHNSEDVGKCTVKMFSEVTALGVPESTRFGIGILNHDNENNQLWTAIKDGEEVKMHIGSIDMTWHPLLKSARKAWKEKVPLHKYVLAEEDLLNYYQVLNDAPDYPLRRAVDKLPQMEFHYGFVFDHGFFYAFSPCEFQPELIHIVQRFSALFGQTYRRYLDLVKAEAQAREAKIEAALERVRSKTMAMHKSEDLSGIVYALYAEVAQLEITDLGCNINIFKEKDMVIESWMAAFGEKELPRSYAMKGMEYRQLKKAWQVWKSQGPPFYLDLQKEDYEDYVKYLLNETELKWLPDTVKQEMLALKEAHLYYINLKYGQIEAVNSIPISEEKITILARFAKVFEQTYTRFLDLQKAEAQGIEASIEAALEKVRSASLSMQNTEDLQKVVDAVFVEMNKLNIGMDHTAFVTLIDGSKDYNVWVGSADANFTTFSRIPYNDWTQVQRDYNDLIANRPGLLAKKYEGEIKKEYSRYLFSQTGFKENTPEKELQLMMHGDSLITSIAMMENTGIQIASYKNKEFTGEENMILQRFATVFEQAYIRFLDLQKAEAQAREARIEAALEKVRSRTMAMQHPDELEDVVVTVVEKLMDLGVVLDANGVIICTYFEDSKDVVHWMASPDFTFSGRYLLPFFDHPIFNDAWNSRLSGDEYFSKAFPVELKNSFYEYAFENSDYKDFPEEFKNWVFQNDKHSLSFAWSKNSAILIPSHTGVVPNEAQIEILKRFAKVFEQAYIRFLDLQVKEEQATKINEEKQRLEKALEHLQATQKQLIQSEKMASLGELTAGIAHEIQNPLNFVNNFSELSNELISEMKEEMDKGDLDEAKAIADDIKQNLEKINHHGKRADNIVKGMLQHSRWSTAEKAPTDINKLADEYMRLAYHGLRAKDKTFNATLKTDFDPILPEIMVISQDIGRVLLNLFSNAFYAVSEKQRNNIEAEYQPRVTIGTEQVDDSIVLTIEDNGTGIPEEILEKIYQPFFTTKPTGQGTGLGLSLSYDIIKAHEGKLEVETEEGASTIFKIILPK